MSHFRVLVRSYGRRATTAFHHLDPSRETMRSSSNLFQSPPCKGPMILLNPGTASFQSQRTLSAKSDTTPYSPLDSYNTANPEHTMDDQVDFIKRDDATYLRRLKKQLADIVAEVDTAERLIEQSENARSKYFAADAASRHQNFRDRAADFRTKVELLQTNLTDLEHEHYTIGAASDRPNDLPNRSASAGSNKPPKRSIENIWSSVPDSQADVFADWKRKVQAMSPEQRERERMNIALQVKRDNITLMRDVENIDRTVKDMYAVLLGGRQRLGDESQHEDKES